MRYGFVLPGGVDAVEMVEWAVQSERAGWDAVFVWEGIYNFDAWALLGAMAQVTERIRLGTMLTPLPRRLPWELAGQAVTVDRLSGGRVILTVGLGAIDPDELGDVGQERDRHLRAELLDEGLAILDGLWKGERFDFAGAHHRVHALPGPRPVQQPRIPVWVVGAWPRPKSMRRVARWDGLVPMVVDATPGGPGHRTPTPDDVREMVAFCSAARPPDAPAIDVVVEGETPAPDDPAANARLGALAEAGVTWWLEAQWGAAPAQVSERIRLGPPRAVASAPVDGERAQDGG